MNGFNNFITYMAIGVLSLWGVNQKIPNIQEAIAESAPAKLIAQIPSPIPTTTTTPTTANPASGRLIKLNITVTSPEDLKVRENDTVTAGQIIADRDKERARLTAAKQQIELSLKKIEETELITPPKPLPVPDVQELPPISYKEEESAISAAELALQQAQRNYELAMGTTPFITQQATVDMASAKIEAAQREVELQARKIDAIANLEGLPPEITTHEAEQLKRKSSEYNQQKAEYDYAAAELENAKQQRTSQLQTLANEVSKAQANVQLAQSKLDTSKTKRGYDEYNHSLNKARRTEESNTFNQNQVRQEQEYSQQQRDREFQLAQLKAKLGEIEQQLGELSIVKSPYSGTIRRIKNVGQTNQNLQFEITLVVNGSNSPRTSTSPTITSPLNTNPLPTPITTPPPIPTRGGGN